VVQGLFSRFQSKDSVAQEAVKKMEEQGHADMSLDHQAVGDSLLEDELNASKETAEMKSLTNIKHPSIHRLLQTKMSWRWDKTNSSHFQANTRPICVEFNSHTISSKREMNCRRNSKIRMLFSLEGCIWSLHVLLHWLIKQMPFPMSNETSKLLSCHQPAGPIMGAA
jgi:hypothetical protein